MNDPKPEGRLHEELFNQGLAKALTNLHPGSKILFKAERVGLLESGMRPDVLAVGGPVPVVLEGEYGTSSGLEADARNKLGAQTKKWGRIEAAVAVAYPPEGKRWEDSDEVANRLSGGHELRYAVWSAPDVRWPESGWMVGDVQSLGYLVACLSQPHKLVSEMAEQVGAAVTAFAQNSADVLSEDDQKRLAVEVGRPTGLDSLQVVGVVWFNALLFQDRIAEAHGLPLRHSCYEGKQINPRELLDVWNRIRRINYLSVYDPAVKTLDTFLSAVSVSRAARLITPIGDESNRVATASADLFDIGAELFQWVISDRDDAASYYTRPEIAEFLARLIRPEHLADGYDRAGFSVGDFACGTGTLLRSVYRRARTAITHDQKESFHRRMMENGFTAIDISPVAAHLTASSLSNMMPAVAYENTNIGVVPIGTPEGRTGSVEFLDQREMRDLFGGTHTRAAHSAEVVGSTAGDGYTLRAPFDSFDVVVMNPPYQRGRGGQKLFDVAGVTETNRKLAVRNARRIIAGTPASMQAGLASVFTVLAVKTCRGGGG